MFKKNSNNELIITRTGVALVSLIVMIIFGVTNVVTYYVSKSIQQAGVMAYHEVKIKDLEESYKQLNSEISDLRKEFISMKDMLNEVKSDIKLIKFHLGIASRGGNERESNR